MTTLAPPGPVWESAANDEDWLARESPDAPEAAPPRYSVFTEGDREAQRHKWVESEKAGRDLGEEALRQWARRHWRGFLRACRMEHLRGERYWSELDRGDFGLLRRAPHDRPTLLAQVVSMLQAGQENLDVILWARQVGAPMPAVLRILEVLDVNSCRLPHRLDP